MQGMHKMLEIVVVDPCQLVEDSSGDTLCLLACSSLLYADSMAEKALTCEWL
jgi:hypothetical protein